MTNKMTQKDYFNEIITLAQANGREDIVKFCEGRIEVLTKKSDNRKSTKTQVENESLKCNVRNALATLDKATVTEIQKADEVLSELSNQKVSALLRQMIDAGEVVKETDKKKSYFSLVKVD
jgi:hypothetical protein